MIIEAEIGLEILIGIVEGQIGALGIWLELGCDHALELGNIALEVGQIAADTGGFGGGQVLAYRCGNTTGNGNRIVG